MADRATQSLEHITGSDEYVLVPDFVVFDEHDEYDDDGKLLRRFDRARLQTIVDQCNSLTETTGDMAVIAPGHSLEEPKSEEDQPPPWGYCTNYRLSRFGPGQKLGVVCDAYVRKAIRTNTGKLVNGPEYVATFPRRSGELWPNHPAVPEHARNTFDWIAVLRRAQQRPIGLSVYARNGRREVIGGVTRSGKLCYQMEIPMPTPVDEPRADVPSELDQENLPPEGHEEFAKHLDYAMANHPHLKHLGAMCKKYGMEEAIPGATNAGAPEDDESSLMQNARRPRPAGDADVQKTKYQRQLDDQERRIKSAEEELKVERMRIKRDKYQMELTKLAEEFDFDISEELTDCVGLDEKAFDRHLTRIKTRYARTPVGGDLPLNAHEIPPAAKTLDDPDAERKIHRYMLDNPKWTQEQGEKAYKEAAKILKFIS